MRILVCNDDGIHAPGLAALEDVARELSDDVWTVAPETEQSGASHSLTFTEPLRLRQLEPRKFAVQGTPSDCIVLALEHVLKDKKPNLLLSGVNRGQNVAEDVTYSGTIAAAMEGTLLGIRAIALSQVYGFDGGPVAWENARQYGPALIRQLLGFDWPAGVLMNINFPDGMPEAVKGTRVTVQGHRHAGELKVEAREDPRGAPYFWIAFRRGAGEVAPDTDLHAVRAGYISVTPLHLDLTHAGMMDGLRQALGEGGE